MTKDEAIAKIIKQLEEKGHKVYTPKADVQPYPTFSYECIEYQGVVDWDKLRGYDKKS